MCGVREISAEAVSRAVSRLCIEANTCLPEGLCEALRGAARQEQSPVGRAILSDVEENFTFARQRGLPICQDTGMAVVFVDWGQDCRLTGATLEEAVNAGVADGYRTGLLRMSTVADPLRRVNTGDNTPAVVHLRMVAGDRVEITVAPKGFGSENMSSLRMFPPSVSPEEVETHIVQAVSRAGSNPCPPIIVGVGLGGTSEGAALLAKRALLRPVGEGHPDPWYREMEERLLARINGLGIGPQGLGGSTTALQVSILTMGTHIAGLPCAVNLGCHVTRHAHTVL